MSNKKQNEIESEGIEIDRLFFVSQTSARCLATYLAATSGRYGGMIESLRHVIIPGLVDNAEELWDELCKRFPAPAEEEKE
jgi:hypothetical protein